MFLLQKHKTTSVIVIVLMLLGSLLAGGCARPEKEQLESVTLLLD